MILIKYSIYYQSPKGTILEKKDLTFFRKIEDKWFIDVAEEFMYHGMIPSPSQEPPIIPENIIDCENDQNCFLDAFEKCNPAKIVTYSEEKNQVTSAIWIDENCLVHQYNDMRGSFMYNGQFYSICKMAPFSVNPNNIKAYYEGCTTPKGWISMVDIMKYEEDSQQFEMELMKENYS